MAAQIPSNQTVLENIARYYKWSELPADMKQFIQLHNDKYLWPDDNVIKQKQQFLRIYQDLYGANPLCLS